MGTLVKATTHQRPTSRGPTSTTCAVTCTRSPWPHRCGSMKSSSASPDSTGSSTPSSATSHPASHCWVPTSPSSTPPAVSWCRRTTACPPGGPCAVTPSGCRAGAVSAHASRDRARLTRPCSEQRQYLIHRENDERPPISRGPFCPTWLLAINPSCSLWVFQLIRRALVPLGTF